MKIIIDKKPDVPYPHSVHKEELMNRVLDAEVVYDSYFLDWFYKIEDGVLVDMNQCSVVKQYKHGGDFALRGNRVMFWNDKDFCWGKPTLSEEVLKLNQEQLRDLFIKPYSDVNINISILNKMIVKFIEEFREFNLKYQVDKFFILLPDFESYIASLFNLGIDVRAGDVKDGGFVYSFLHNKFVIKTIDASKCIHTLISDSSITIREEIFVEHFTYPILVGLDKYGVFYGIDAKCASSSESRIFSFYNERLSEDYF